MYNRDTIQSWIISNDLNALKEHFQNRGTDAYHNYTASNGWTILHSAVAHGKYDIVKFIIEMKMYHCNEQDSRGRTALHLAIKPGNEKIVKLLLQETGFDVHHRDNSGETPLHLAAKHQSVEMLELTSEKRKGVHYYLDDKNGRTPLHVAAEYGRDQNVEFLLLKSRYFSEVLENNNIINTKDNSGQTALDLAAYNNKINVVKLLCDMPNIDINSQGKNGYTALYLAVTRNHRDIVEFLLQMPKIQVNPTDKHGLNVLNYAIKYGFTSIETLLLQALELEFVREAFQTTPENRDTLLNKYDMIDTSWGKTYEYLERLVEKQSDPAKKVDLLKNAIQCDDSQKPSNALSSLMHQKGFFGQTSPTLMEINNSISLLETPQYGKSRSYWWNTKDELPQRLRDETKNIARRY